MPPLPLPLPLARPRRAAPERVLLLPRPRLPRSIPTCLRRCVWCLCLVFLFGAGGHATVGDLPAAGAGAMQVARVQSMQRGSRQPEEP